MAGRDRMHRRLLHEEMRGFREGPPLSHGRGPMPPPPHLIEEKLARCHDEIRRLVADNRLLIEENIAMKRDMDAAGEEIHNIELDIPRMRAEQEAKTRELIQMGLKLEADLRALEPLKAEASELQGEAQRLDAMRVEMTKTIQSMSQNLKRIQTENQHMPKLKREIEGLREDHVRVRTALEYEQKAHAELMEQRQAMEKNLVSMAREIEKLRAEQMSVEKRGRGPGAYGAEMGGYPGSFGDGYGREKGAYGAEMGGYPGSFGDAYGREKGLGHYGAGAGAGAGSWSSWFPRP